MTKPSRSLHTASVVLAAALGTGFALVGAAARFYSFVEDFRRDGKSPDERRSAIYSGGWVRTKDGDWVSLTRANFTADRTPLLNVDAEAVEGGFRLRTGGEIENRTPLRSTISRLPNGIVLPE